MADTTTRHRYASAAPSPSHAYLLPVVARELDALGDGLPADGRRLFDLGCGNGSVGAWAAARGWRVAGIDPSQDGIALARETYPQLALEPGSAYEDLAARFGTFPAVLSLEVVEHLYDPPCFASRLHDLLEPGGTAIVSTPYHGYVKNLAVALAGRFDGHVNALKTGGHIKFFSVATLGRLLEGAGLRVARIHRCGRLGPLAKSMIAVATRPA